MPVNFDLNDLYAFRALVEFGNFRLAAFSVSVTRRVVRSNSLIPSEVSSLSIRRLSADCERQIDSAARRKLPNSTSARNA